MTTSISDRNQEQQAFERSQVLLAKNLSAVSLAENQLFSVLDGGSDSFVMRNHLVTVLHSYLNSMNGPRDAADIRRKLRMTLSTKDTIAMAASMAYSVRVGPAIASSTTPIDDAQLRQVLNEVIDTLSKELINKQNFNESWMVRHAALSNFECKLNPAESKTLASVCEKMKKIAKDNGLEDLSEIMHFQKESHAQQIVKLKEGMAICAEQGIEIDDTVTTQFEKLKEKIQPLEDLDHSYKHLMNTLNMVHRTGRKGFKSMINSSQQKKLFKVLDDLGQKDATFVFNAAEQAKDQRTLETEYMKLKNADTRKFAEVLRANNITQSEFERNFFSYFNFRNIEEARLNFDQQKQATFGHKIKAFEGDVNKWRGMAREKVLEIHTRMREVGGVMTFGTPEDYNTANSYFEQFKNIFFANEDDAFGPEGGHFRQMRDVVAAIIRKRVPAICATGKKRFGPALRRIIERMGSSSTFSRMDRRWNDADDAQLIAMIIMTQNESTNMLFYDDKNPFTKDPKGMQKLTANVGRTEMARAAVRDVISKPANTFATLAEGAVKIGLKGTNKVVSKTGRGLTWLTREAMSKMNGVVENGKAKWRKLPFYAAYPITRSGEKIAKYAKKGFDYTDLHGNEQMHKFRENIIGLMQDGFKDKEIKHAYQGFFHAFEGITSLLGKSVSAIGNAAHDKIHTNNQRAILGSFFEAASKEEDLMTLMQSSDLANLLNLKESGPYLFDNDGRSLSATKKGPKEYSEDEAGANEYMKDQSKQIMDEQHKILKQYTDRMNAEYEANEEQLASMSVVDPEYSKVQKALEGAMIKQEALRSKETSISDMISALQNFLRSGDVNVFESTVNTLHKEFKDTKDNSDTIITNAQSTLKAQTKIKEDKAKELADINDKLSRLNSTDKGYKELSDERITADGERIKKRNTLRTLEDKIRDNIGDKQKHEKKRDYLESEVKELKKKAERKTEYNNAVDMLNELEKDLETKRALLENIKQEERQNNGGGRGKNGNNRNNPEKEILISDIKDISEKEKRLRNIIYMGVAIEDVDYETNLKDAQTQLDNTNQVIIDNETAYKKLISSKDNAQDEYDEAVSKVAALDAKLNAKMSGDKGYVELSNERKAAESSIETADKEIATQQSILSKETHKSKVYTDLYRWAVRMQGFAVNMKKTHDNNIASVTPDPKKYMDDVKRLLADFEGYIIGKKAFEKNIPNAEINTETVKRLFNIVDDTQAELIANMITASKAKK